MHALAFMWAHKCHGAHVEVIGQPAGVCSLLPGIKLRSSGLVASSFTH